MQLVSVFIAFLAVTSLVVAQSPPGYNYPSPFNQLTPGVPGDLGAVPGSNVQQASQQTSYTGSQPAYNNQPFSPAVPQGPPAFGATPAYNQAPQFGPTASSNIPNIPAASSHSGAPGHSSSAGFPSSQSAFPSIATPAAAFPHSGSHSGHAAGGHSVGHSGHSTGSAAGTSFTLPGSPSFSGSSDGGSFGAPSSFGNQGGQTGFGGQGNFGPTGGSTQFQGQGGNDDGSYNGGDYSAIPGTPGVDYPIYTEIPKTSFDCKTQQFPGYYADVEAQCQVFHICALNTTFNFLCPNGTIFSQEHLVCVWWNQFDCNTAQSLYGNNAYIYDYSKTGQPSNAQGQSNNFGTDSGSGFDGSQGSGFTGGLGGGQSAPGFGASHHSGSHSGSHSPSSGFGAVPPSAFGSPSSAPGFGASATVGYPSPSVGTGFGVGSPVGQPGFGASSVPSSGFGPSVPSHSSGFGQTHIPSAGSSHSSSHVPSSHSFSSPSQPSGVEYPIVPPASQPDYQSSVISPTIPSSTTFSSGPVTGYPPAGTPSAPINTGLNGDQPSREYLPSRRV